MHQKSCKQHYRECNKRNCKTLLFSCFYFHVFNILENLFINYEIKENGVKCLIKEEYD